MTKPKFFVRVAILSDDSRVYDIAVFDDNGDEVVIYNALCRREAHRRCDALNKALED